MNSNTTLKNYKTNTGSGTPVIPEKNKYRKYKTEIRRQYKYKELELDGGDKTKSQDFAPAGQSIPTSSQWSAAGAL